MIKVEYPEVWGFKHAIRGMRNPMNSWAKSDSGYQVRLENDLHVTPDQDWCCQPYVIGPNDLDLMKRLYKSGPPHRKYLRQIFVSMDIVAPLYWWKEFDTYKVGTTSDSCSTMHKIHTKEFESDDFSHEHLFIKEKLATIIQWLNDYRKLYVNWVDSPIHVDDYGNVVTKKDVWWQLIQLLPSSYNQRRTVTFTYENVMNMLDYRDPHKLDEWNEFCGILKTLPYVKEIRGDEETS